MKRDDTQSCSEVRDRIPLFVGGDLDAEALESVRTHLDDCEACARDAGDASRAREVFVTSFREREAALPRPDLWADLRGVLVQEGHIRQGSSGPLPASPTGAREESRRPRLRLVRYAGSLAAAAAIVIFAALNLSQGPKTLDVIDSGPSTGLAGPGPIATVEIEDVSATGLTRVPAGEEGLIDTALELRHVHPQTNPNAPGVSLRPELVRYR